MALLPNLQLSSFMSSHKSKLIGFLVFLAVITGLTVGVYNYVKMSEPKTSYKPNVDNTGEMVKSAQVYFFYTTWCPYSTKALPEWESVVNKYNNTTVNGYNLSFISVNCTNETPEVDKYIQMYNIEGYPTIKLVKDDHIIEFDAKATSSNIESFIKTVL